ncbi:hypothetical protein A2291_03365 [candidate division WOR-1 bacterium RIFOXYB2_FULL_42_35]|uniref:histidine kinase n=1 Tax=candidate division WOR-1 bacterium RIFOXYC2_FULL_41_25 TaxID=1802586 RepID=A0A1F4TTM5_UNCSA|nr:MAG: hypothetical protein A2247_02640 [candidate division WOR-1 bacterium RIFOXYA2_FULL_41_14]OGC25779.1 MAG: hypothetical protein A2291_03365 [candidate division WOR-1 bacterium RIFOXYB2_FULL_42_35]OGC35413.1 MAG: hypothetical protein A2462_02595 [candidate division WOR-1 bacterium RIFOXYC2_FULL_41_25]OGC42445.1 MAG: hypothetical protein A2548_01945 [candidate division WOR-1 bacterium RIFOXYD2_FULL_41_8]
MLTKQKELLLANKLATFGEVAISMVHELRQPLTALKGMTQAVMQNPEDLECLADFKAVVPQELDRLINLLESLLKLGQVPEHSLETVDLNHLLQRISRLFASRCLTRQIKIVEKFSNRSEIQADPDQLSQVFINLIVNAIQAMPNGGGLKICTAKKDRMIVVTIADTGSGIRKENVKKIFQPFFSGKKNGLGLGLALVEKIIKYHHGTITVKSKVGKGTEFTIKLPTKQASGVSNHIRT